MKTRSTYTSEKIERAGQLLPTVSKLTDPPLECCQKILRDIVFYNIERSRLRPVYFFSEYLFTYVLLIMVDLFNIFYFLHKLFLSKNIIEISSY